MVSKRVLISLFVVFSVFVCIIFFVGFVGLVMTFLFYVPEQSVVPSDDYVFPPEPEEIVSQPIEPVVERETIRLPPLKINTIFSTDEKFCGKIDPYDLGVRLAASEAARKHPGSYSLDQVFDVYDWVVENVDYLSVPTGMVAPFHPRETLLTRSGDCKNQAVLIASMVMAVGGEAHVVFVPECQHAFALVAISEPDKDMYEVFGLIREHYGYKLSATDMMEMVWVTALEEQEGRSIEGDVVKVVPMRWLVFDPAGGEYPGYMLPECYRDNITFYEVMSCVEPP